MSGVDKLVDRAEAEFDYRQVPGEGLEDVMKRIARLRGSTFLGLGSILTPGGIRTSFMFRSADGEFLALAPQDAPLLGSWKDIPMPLRVRKDVRVENVSPTDAIPRVNNGAVVGLRSGVAVALEDGHSIAFVGKFTCLEAVIREGS